MRQYNCGCPYEAHSILSDDVLAIVMALSAGPWPACRPQLEQVRRTGISAGFMQHLVLAAHNSAPLAPLLYVQAWAAGAAMLPRRLLGSCCSRCDGSWGTITTAVLAVYKKDWSQYRSGRCSCINMLGLCFTSSATAGCSLTCLQFGVAKALRTLVVYVLSAASFTMNLPPMSTAPRLWDGVAVRLA